MFVIGNLLSVLPPDLLREARSVDHELIGERTDTPYHNKQTGITSRRAADHEYRSDITLAQVRSSTQTKQQQHYVDIYNRNIHQHRKHIINSSLYRLYRSNR